MLLGLAKNKAILMACSIKRNMVLGIEISTADFIHGCI